MDNFKIIKDIETNENTLLNEFLLNEIDVYKERTRNSYELHQRALHHVPNGVSSDYQLFEPYPFYVDIGNKSCVIDVDNNKLIDFHGGFGVTLFGYCHPYIIDVSNKLTSEQGFLVSLPSTKLVEVSEMMTNIYQLPYWRYTNSGTEATLDAIRIARAKYDRPYIIKVESGYHGHHDGVWVSVHAGMRDINDTDIPSVPYCSGIPMNTSSLTLIAEYNNIDSIKQLLLKHPNEIACVIVEPILLNCSMIKPKSNYLQSLIDLCRSNDVIIIFDLVKINTGINVKNITKFWSSNDNAGPDMYTFGKGLSGGNCPIGAIGMTEEFATLIQSRKVQVAGTYYGNSYALGLVHAVLKYVSEEKQAELESYSEFLYISCKSIIEERNLPIIIDYIGNKGCLTFIKNGKTLSSLSNYQDYVHNVDTILEQLFVFYFINRGIWVQTRDEWSISFQHTKDDIDAYVACFRAFADKLVELKV